LKQKKIGKKKQYELVQEDSELALWQAHSREKIKRFRYKTEISG
jgi:hypothetical protein